MPQSADPLPSDQARALAACHRGSPHRAEGVDSSEVDAEWKERMQEHARCLKRKYDAVVQQLRDRTNTVRELTAGLRARARTNATETLASLGRFAERGLTGQTLGFLCAEVARVEIRE